MRGVLKKTAIILLSLCFCFVLISFFFFEIAEWKRSVVVVLFLLNRVRFEYCALL